MSVEEQSQPMYITTEQQVFATQYFSFHVFAEPVKNFFYIVLCENSYFV